MYRPNEVFCLKRDIKLRLTVYTGMPFSYSLCRKPLFESVGIVQSVA